MVYFVLSLANFATVFANLNSVPTSVVLTLRIGRRTF